MSEADKGPSSQRAGPERRPTEEPRWAMGRREHLRALLDFLAPRESCCVGLTSRLARSGNFKLPDRGDGSVYCRLADKEGFAVSGCILHTPYGTLFPMIEEDSVAKNEAKLARKFGGRASFLHSIVGMSSGAASVLRILGREPSLSIDYRMMRLSGDIPEAALVPPLRGLVARPASRSDSEALFPLQERYEREEVLTECDSFNPVASRASLERCLRRERVYLLELEGVCVAKAGTNARGIAWDQIGGVFTEKGLRGRGFGRYLCASLFKELSDSGRGICLFVKKRNVAAIRLYEGLGFATAGDFTIHYFHT